MEPTDPTRNTAGVNPTSDAIRTVRGESVKLNQSISELNNKVNSTLRKFLSIFLGFYPSLLNNWRKEDKKQFTELKTKYVALLSQPALGQSAKKNLEQNMAELFVNVFGGKVRSSSAAVLALDKYLVTDKDIKEAVKHPAVINKTLALTERLVADVRSAVPSNNTLQKFDGVFDPIILKQIKSFKDSDRKIFNGLQRNVNEVRSVLRNENIDASKLGTINSDLYFIQNLLDELGKARGWTK